MSNESKLLFKYLIKYDFIIGSILIAMIIFVAGINFASLFLLGLVVSVTNFILSGIILEKALSGESWIKGIVVPLSYVIRIVLVVFIAIPFINDMKSILFYLLGFITHFPILIFSFIKKQKGSE